MEKKYKLAFFFYGYNLAETTRAIEVAIALRKRGVQIEFFSHGGPHSIRPAEVGFTHTLLLPEHTPKHHDRFLDLDHGKARGELFSPEEWMNFAKSEIEVLTKFKPDAVYGGFNLSSVLSTRATNCPLVYLLPAQATPAYYENKMGTFPEFIENPVTRIIPQSWKNFLFNQIMTKINYMPIRNINRAAKALGARLLKSPFEILSGDLVLLSDLAEMTGLPSSKLPLNHFYIGPIFAHLPLEVPEEVKKVFNGSELKIFCAMGSSGTAEVLRATINALKETPYRVVAATTSIVDPEEFRPFSDRFYVTRYLPATNVNEMADIAVTHGGQGTVQNSIWAGKPLIGVPFQFEQQGNLEMVARAGVGIKIPMVEYTSERLLREIKRVADNPKYLQSAQKISSLFKSQNGAENSAQIILDFLNKRNS